MGLYFYSTVWDQVIDYKKFQPKYCDHMRYCQYTTASGSDDDNNEMLFSLDESRFSTLNFLPDDTS